MSCPKHLRYFAFHGVNLHAAPAGGDEDNLIGDCPFCGKDEHFFASIATGLWDCKVCGEQGNDITFLTKLATLRNTNTRRKRWTALSRRRGIPAGILKARKLGWCPETGRWLLPCFSDKGTARDIRAWDPKTGMMKSTASRKSQLYGVERLAKNKRTTVYLCEGEWDALAMDWLLRDSNSNGVAVAVPGATVLKKDWLRYFQSRNVIACYDADSAGDKGAAKALKALKPVARTLKFVNWPDGLPKGFDLRDFVKHVADTDAKGWASSAMRELEALYRDTPRRGEVGSAKQAAEASTSAARDLPELRSMDFQELCAIFGQHIMMTPDMDDALKVMMAVGLSTDIQSDPLWVYIVGAPGAGKTLLLQGMQGSERCVFRSTITPHGLVSGWSQGDPSLIPKLSGRCLVVKDFTEILSMQPQARDEIYSTLRGAFDGSVDKSFGNGVHRVYNRSTEPPFFGFSLLAGVTHAIHGQREASLGERFLKFQLRAPRKAPARRINLLALNSIGTERKREDKLQWATACFLDRKLTIDELPAFPEALACRLDALVTLVAYMRAQVAKNQFTDEILYRPQPEMGTRLMKQLGLLGRLLAYIDGASVVGSAQFDIVTRVAYNTAHGFHLEIVDTIMRNGGRATRKFVQLAMAVSDATVHRRFQDLETVKAIRKLDRKEQVATGGRPATLWSVTKTIARIWLEAKGLDVDEWVVKNAEPAEEPKVQKRRKRRLSVRLSSGSKPRSKSRSKRKR